MPEADRHSLVAMMDCHVGNAIFVSVGLEHSLGHSRPEHISIPTFALWTVTSPTRPETGTCRHYSGPIMPMLPAIIKTEP